jgi:hypothetical protein
MVLLCLKKKILAWKVRRKLVRSLCTETGWKLEKESLGTSVCYKKDDFVVGVIRSPIFLRIFDRVTVFYKGNDVWFPLLSRLRIRCAVRWRILQEVNSHLK